MKKEEIRIRDPFVLPYEGKYYMYGVGMYSDDTMSRENADRQILCYISADLDNWSEAIVCFEAPLDFWARKKEYWAPEVHCYKDKFYMFVTFIGEGKMRATQALVSETPTGPFRVWSEPLTPADWMCLDGTLYIENDVPYLVFCHEWVQARDGGIAFVPLKEDLSGTDGETQVLFRASQSGWAHPITEDRQGFVTDGPWIVKEEDGLYMFWSSFQNGNYAVGIAMSESSTLAGPWKHSTQLLFEKDGGHCMMFHGFNGKRYIALHQPNTRLQERARFLEIEKIDCGFKIINE